MIIHGYVVGTQLKEVIHRSGTHALSVERAGPNKTHTKHLLKTSMQSISDSKALAFLGEM